MFTPDIRRLRKPPADAGTSPMPAVESPLTPKRGTNHSTGAPGSRHPAARNTPSPESHLQLAPSQPLNGRSSLTTFHLVPKPPNAAPVAKPLTSLVKRRGGEKQGTSHRGSRPQLPAWAEGGPQSSPSLAIPPARARPGQMWVRPRSPLARRGAPGSGERGWER